MNMIYSKIMKALEWSQHFSIISLWRFFRVGRYDRDTGISRYFISVIRIVIQFGRIAIFSSLFIVTISCWNFSIEGHIDAYTLI